ncbi:MAG: NAD(P)H-dependent oxidoreductase [Methanoregula sp.]|nr:NAD(P)H-dependent oxidoreductase [Methanoregula sp.]
MTIRIVYFSWKGHTHKVATALAKFLDAELIRIEPVRDIHVGREAFKALLKMKSPIRPAKTDLAGIDTLIVASPVWAGRVPAYVNAYLDSVTGGAGKPFHVIAEMGGSGDQSAIAVVKKALEKKGMTFVSSATTIEKDVDSGAFAAVVEKFADGIRTQ